MTKAPQPREGDELPNENLVEIQSLPDREQDESKSDLERRIRLKVDLRLCTIAGILCSLNLLDSGVISSAAVTSMPRDLGLDQGNRFSVSIFIFTIASIAFQLPSTIAVRTFGPRIWFSLITVAFGLITLGTAFVTTWSQMIALRVLLGMACSGVFPGLTYVISTWYTRKEQQLRFALMQSGEVIVLATGGIVNFGLNRLDGRGGLKGWQWMFIVQGAITAFFGILTYWWMPSFPEDAHTSSFLFLTPEESKIAADRIQRDRGDVQADPFSWPKVLQHAADLKIYGFCIMYFLQNLVSTTLSYFLPIILQGGMRYSADKAILLSAPPYYYAVLPAILSSLVGDRFQLRGPIITLNCLCLIAGFGMLGFAEQVAVRYVGTFLATGAYVANWAALATYQANNVVGQWKRVFTAAAVTAFNGAGGIAGSFIVRRNEAPRYATAVWVSIGNALYDYVPQSENEIALAEGDLLMVLEKSTDDDWWRAKKKIADSDEEEPEGLIPNNYVEEATPISKAKALYDYTRQTDEELSFQEDAILDVYDTSDPDWTLVGVDGDFGFAPSNYIDFKQDAAPVSSPALPPRPAAAPAPAQDSDDEPQPPTPESPVHQSPAAALAGIIQQKAEQQSAPRATVSPPPTMPAPQKRVQFTPEESDQEEAPPPRLPARPQSQQISPPPTQYPSPRSPESPPARSPPPRSVTFDAYVPPEGREQPQTPLSASGYHLYNIYEYITQPGKNKKMPVTLGINIPKGIIMLAPEKARDGQQQEWTADKMEYYSQEGKHVFLELKRPSKSVDLHCGAKDTASEIVSFLGELSGAAKASGLREVLAAGSGHSNVQKKGHMLFDFMAQGDDEVTVAVGDEVLIIDDSASDEWWKVRRLKNGKEGVVPSNYVEITDIAVSNPAGTSDRSGINAGRSVVEQNRLEEEELARRAARSSRQEGDGRADQEARSSSKPSAYSFPPDILGYPLTGDADPAKVRTWTDRTGSFKVEAEFLTIKDGKIHLHKVNGVKIAVPVPKMSVEDLEYVERVTGVSLDDDKPLSDIKRRSMLRTKEQAARGAGITVEHKPSYDWFDFFLQCGVNPQICERYAQAFNRDQMGEENLPDITDRLLRTLGLKEGDILRVMKFLDNKFGRTGERDKRNVSFAENGEEGSGGGLFSGPGGVLRNNTRKGRPAPPVQTNDVVDPKAFEQKSDEAPKKPADSTATPLASAPVPDKKVDGFEDNAWEVKPSRQPSTTAPPPAASPPPASTQPPAAASAATTSAPAPASSVPALTGSLEPPTAQPQPPAQAQQPEQSQPAGANYKLFEQVAAIQPLPPQQLAPPRVRPQAPQQQNAGGLIAPPPQRAASAPQNPQAAFGPPPPLQPQLTGYNGAPHMQTQVSPPGASLQDLNMQRLQQQMTGFPQQNPAFQPQPTGFQPQQNGLMPQPTGFQTMPAPMQPLPTGYAPPLMPQPTGFQAPMQTGFPAGIQQPGFQATASPFNDPPRPPFQPLQPQPTGFTSFPAQPLNPQATGINRFLPPAIQPTVTGMGIGATTTSPPPVPPIPPMPQAQPLVPQKTGPPPPVRFGVQPAAKKLVPQPTGRANLAKATPQNPFGFE
ncbi:uncharacterized protein EI97DRAFT_448880 [Westerdykella ornata]|uniref:Actin cytoskeleton-regulatory complex protein SLA1 n=1 Tax=Westerdykella ornata TaxID=318751 RepID=A0A6A6JNQ7_WESOR|nr:uncharacterized protein EI97DRAFT_448880 [Westerdykella ornata]KAF2278152.1 hypothetical protein EI97DRAFT_448880 [Westerdykella ornata]